MYTRERRIKRLQESSRGPEWPIATRFYKRELLSVLDHISDKNVDPSIKISLRKYLIISCVSLIEDFLSHLIMRTIDQYGIQISSLIGKQTEIEANISVSEYGIQIGKTITKGQYIGSRFSYANSSHIDSVFTDLLKIDKNFKMLNMNFFDAVKKIDSSMPFIRFVKGVRSLYHTWNDFINIFELRTEVVHDMKEIDMSDRRLKSYCNNTMTFLSASIFVVDPLQRVIELLKRK